MRLSDLRDAKVKTLDGDTLGRVHEVHCDDGRITAVMCGPGSFIERLTAGNEGRRIPWGHVRKVSRGEIIVAPDPPKRKAGSSGSRTPRRTPQASARRSKR